MRPRRLLRRLRALLQRGRVERELADELRGHLERDAAERVRRGASAAAARREAGVAFGGYDAVSEACRDVRGVGRLEELRRDVRYAARSLRRSPTFTVAAVAVLALGVGAMTAVFSIAEGVLLRPLPYAAADRLYSLYERSDAGGVRPASYPMFRDWAAAGALASVAYIRGETLGVRGEDGMRLLLAGYASEGFFETLGTAPALGRVWDRAEAQAGAAVAVLSDAAWRESFGADAGVIGRPLATESGPLVVIGVMPPGYRYPAWAEVWRPLEALSGDQRQALVRRDLHVDAQVVGRIVEGRTPQAVAAALQAVDKRIEARHADAEGWTGARLDGVRAELLGDARTRIALLAGAVCVLLLIACVNVAGLLIARGAGRGREVATRIALGAGRRRVARQFVAEALLLGAAGGALGAVFGALAVRLVVVAAPAALPRLDGVSADWRAAAFALAVGCVTAVLFGLLPAARASNASPMTLLRSGRGAVGGRWSVRLRSGLVAAEVALATLLVIGAALLLRTLGALERVPLGIEPEGVVAVRITPPARYDEPERALALFRSLEETARRVQGVRHAALVNHLPLSGTSMPTSIAAGGTTAQAPPFALVRTISADYTATLGARIAEGRPISDADVAARAPVALVNETLANQLWPDASAVGRSMRIRHAAQGRPDFGEELTVTIVGVVVDVRAFGPQIPPQPEVYVPVSTMIWPSIFLAARTSEETAVVAERLRRALVALDPSLPVAGPGFQQRVRPLTDYESSRVLDRRLNAAVLTSFAAIAFALAAVGVFGIVAYIALERRPEFGLRMSLGARPADIVRLVVAGGLKLVLAGIAIGLLAAAFATRLLQGLLFGVAPGDVRSFVAAGALFLLAGIVAGAIPAVRAARTEPARILRTE
jgi:putative ABC transport system permease protein